MGKYVVHFKKTATARTDTSTPKKRRDVLGSQRSSRRGVLVPVCAVAIFFICHPFVTCLYSEPSYRHRARLYVPQPWRKKSCFFFFPPCPHCSKRTLAACSRRMSADGAGGRGIKYACTAFSLRAIWRRPTFLPIALLATYLRLMWSAVVSNSFSSTLLIVNGIAHCT